jgi:hypothetical protein
MMREITNSHQLPRMMNGSELERKAPAGFAILAADGSGVHPKY